MGGLRALSNRSEGAIAVASLPLRGSQQGGSFGVGATPDGGIGAKTIEKLNQVSDGKLFKQAYALAKMARYAEICNQNRTQVKFLLGWLNRTLKGLK